MKVHKTEFPGLLIIEPDVYNDPRGYFFESYNKLKYSNNEIVYEPVQDNESSSCRGVIRGLHYQEEPFAQAKLIRVIEGRIYDVALDIRRGSPTFGRWFGLIIDSEKKLQFLIPKGFAHGFSVLSERAIVLYKCDNVYSVEHERGINALDPALGIDWMISDEAPVISPKDMKQPLFGDITTKFIFSE
ncbi:MAG: dTDP-4-dehydrorhamnose 3,5-epimerase [Bacteroidales bacterium]|nr:dTDP-4-dehydrorhamnose 3,5-epimerase [Bacteroidales bacterium]NLD63763.1 dTDP-4-dehydrorhamnose 3,5-epimerase [Bacteroidales bacterium]